jgi:hypothetical protein
VRWGGGNPNTNTNTHSPDLLNHPRSVADLTLLITHNTHDLILPVAAIRFYKHHIIHVNAHNQYVYALRLYAVPVARLRSSPGRRRRSRRRSRR